MKPICVMSLAVILLSSTGLFAQSRVDKPNEFSLELLGRGLIYSITFQHLLSHSFGLEVGAEWIPTGDGSAFALFGGGRIYLLKKNTSPTLSGGIGYGGDEDGSFVYFYVGPGIEYRTSGDFVLHGGVYFLIHGEFNFPWPGISLGVAF